MVCLRAKHKTRGQSFLVREFDIPLANNLQVCLKGFSFVKGRRFDLLTRRAKGFVRKEPGFTKEGKWINGSGPTTGHPFATF